MGSFKFDNVFIKSIAACVPKNKVETLQYPYLFTEKEKNKFVKATGIKERRIVENNIVTSDLGYHAAIEILKSKNIKKDDISCLVFLSQTSDYRIPFTSNILQHRLGLSSHCSCIDIIAGCSGFVTGLQTAFSLQNSLLSGNVLVIIAETMSKILSPKDRATSLIFGDGGAAVLLEKNINANMSYFTSNSDGQYAEVLQIPDSGYKSIVNENSFEMMTFEDGSERNKMHLYMDGAAVLDFTMREVVPSVTNLNRIAGLEANEIDFYIFHQSNKFIINQFANELNISAEKLVINIDRFGNTSGVSIPLAIVTELFNKSVGRVHVSGYGAGLSWANAIIDLSKTDIIALIEI